MKILYDATQKKCSQQNHSVTEWLGFFNVFNFTKFDILLNFKYFFYRFFRF